MVWQNYTMMLNGLLANEWTSMSPEEALEYYTMYEICELLNSRGRNDYCNNYPGGNYMV